jgi:phage shock protein C
MEPKRLYRSSRSRVFGGVAGGIADYFSIDPVLVRLLFVALAILGGGGVLIYIILWIVLPEYNPVNFSADFSSASTPHVNPQPQTEPEMSNQNPFPRKEDDDESKTKGAIIAGVILITLGSLFFIDNLIPSIDFGDLWPVLLIVIGLVILLTGMPGKRKNMNS